MFASFSKLTALFRAKKRSYFMQFTQSLKLSLFSLQIKDLHRSLKQSSLGMAKDYCRVVDQPLQSLKVFSSFLIQLRLILDNPRRDMRRFFQVLKKREELAKLVQSHLDKKAKILTSQALLVFRKLRIFAKYRRQLYKAFLSRRLG